MSLKLLMTTTAILLSLTGCATVTRGSTEALVIESEPSGAQVQLSNGMKGTTPTSFKVKRKNDLTVTVSKPGYETASINVTSQMAGSGGAAMAGNVLVGGIIGMAVDASSGATKELKPNPVKITLNPY
ncbi:PEGA domain-containing protein [uncultured Thiothrix sp.]|uniref:PEGA domain-containing protein n=1 Tax=uncultured Thiothrix sp. TaxID=223185 RepID=UPI00262AC1A4|nr:PEGA domain-containing protein [uncultured Thiothrix sp.]